MSFTSKCPHCQAEYEYGMESIGQEKTCSNCQTTIIVELPELTEGPAPISPKKQKIALKMEDEPIPLVKNNSSLEEKPVEEEDKRICDICGKEIPEGEFGINMTNFNDDNSFTQAFMCESCNNAALGISSGNSSGNDSPLKINKKCPQCKGELDEDDICMSCGWGIFW